MVESKISDNASLKNNAFTMTNKKICYFISYFNNVMIYDIQSNTWSEKTIEKPGFEFKKDAVAVTLPNGDCLITGGLTYNSVY